MYCVAQYCVLTDAGCGVALARQYWLIIAAVILSESVAHLSGAVAAANGATC